MTKDKRIKVLHLISGDLWAGAETQALTLISWLNKRPELELLSITFNQGRLSQEIRQLGVPTYVFDENKNNIFRLFLTVRRILSKEKIDVLHTHRYKENVIGSLAAQFSGHPYLVKTVHGLAEPFKGVKRTKANFYNFLDRWTSKLFFHRIICVSFNIGEKLKKELSGTRVVSIHNGVDIEMIKTDKPMLETKKELEIEPDSTVIGTVGRLAPVKGIDFLLKAAKILRKEIPGLKILIVGEGPERLHLQKLACELGIDSHVIFTGQREDVLDLMSCMDIFVLPSLSEGIPMALLEALALGKPVVATNVGGIPEILEDGQTGLLVPPQDEKALATTCQYLLGHRDKAKVFAEKAKKKVQENFSAQVMAEKVAQIYRSLAV